MGLSGTWVRTFAEATHALPDGMHMNADYPFMLPRIAACLKIDDVHHIRIVGRGGEIATAKIETNDHGEYAYIDQSSSYERTFRRKPTRFKLLPFKGKEL